MRLSSEKLKEHKLKYTPREEVCEEGRRVKEQPSLSEMQKKRPGRWSQADSGARVRGACLIQLGSPTAPALRGALCRTGA